MRILQLLPTISFGDAVGNDTIALKSAIKSMGYKTAIYAENIDSRIPRGIAKNIKKMPIVTNDDIIIYHKSTGTDLSFKLETYKCRKIMIYHNITPPSFFEPYNIYAKELTEYGLEGLKFLKDKCEYCIADSTFNKQNLIDIGYTCPIDVRPILIPFEDYKKTPNENIIKQYSNDGYTNIIFVGRIAPNKKQEDVIRAFYQYKKINPKSRLIFVGSYQGMENYYERLLQYTTELQLKDVIFTGHIKFNAILAYYKIADVFLCMSQHEGFCVPLVEAMFFEIPIIAYNSCAVPNTLGGSGILLNSNDPLITAMTIEKVMKDDELRNYIIKTQNKRLKDFQYDNVKSVFEQCINKFLGKK